MRAWLVCLVFCGYITTIHNIVLRCIVAAFKGKLGKHSKYMWCNYKFAVYDRFILFNEDADSFYAQTFASSLF